MTSGRLARYTACATRRLAASLSPDGRQGSTRRLARDFERRTGSAEAMIYWSMTLLMTRRLARPRPCEGEPLPRWAFGPNQVGT